MKPINSREKSKQLWQFVFIFFGLALIPVALIFFSYYKVPEEISESEARKLVNYSNFEHTQKLIMKKMTEVDSNINIYADASTSYDPEILGKKILNELDDLSNTDTSLKMVQIIRTSYENHYKHAKELVKAREEKKEAILKQQKAEADLKDAQRNPMGAGGFPLPPAQ